MPSRPDPAPPGTGTALCRFRGCAPRLPMAGRLRNRCEPRSQSCKGCVALAEQRPKLLLRKAQRRSRSAGKASLKLPGTRLAATVAEFHRSGRNPSWRRHPAKSRAQHKCCECKCLCSSLAPPPQARVRAGGSVEASQVNAEIHCNRLFLNERSPPNSIGTSGLAPELHEVQSVGLRCALHMRHVRPTSSASRPRLTQVACSQ